MANPTIRFNNLTGSDTAASGTVPDLAVGGSNARNLSVGALRVAFFEATPPSLSGVPTDGSSCLWVKGAASGRKFSKISAVKTSTQNVSGSTIIGNATVTVASSAGMVLGCIVRITGAGPGGGDLYTVVQSAPTGTTITVSPVPERTVAVAGVWCPPQVTIEDSLAISTANLWAIGGRRKTLVHADSDDIVAADAKPGWRIRLESTGTAYAGGFQVNVPGSDAAGIVLEGGVPGDDPVEVSTSGSLPTLTLGANSNRWKFRNIKLVKSGSSNNPTILDSSASSYGFQFERLDVSNTSIGGSDCVGYLQSTTTGMAFFRRVFRECAFHDCRYGAFRRVPGGTTQTWGLSFYNCMFYNLPATGLDVRRLRGAFVWNCIFYDYVGEALTFAGDASGDCSFSFVYASLFDSNENASAGIAYHYLGDLTLCFQANNTVVRHNAMAVQVVGNIELQHDFYMSYLCVGSGRAGGWGNSTLVGSLNLWDIVEDVPLDFQYQTVPGWPDDVRPVMIAYDSGFIDAINGGMNYGLGSDALIGLGYPVHEIGSAWDTDGSATRSYVDLGVSQQVVRPPVVCFARKVS